jgi:hypothetical protein
VPAEASLEERRELYLAATVDFTCEIARRTAAGPLADGEGVQILHEAWARHGLTPLQYGQLSRDLHWDQAIRTEIDRQAAICHERATTGAGSDPQPVPPPEPVPPAGPGRGLPAEPAAQQAVYAAIGIEAQCAFNADAIIGRTAPEEEHHRRFDALLAAQGLTLDEWMVLNDRFSGDPEAVDERRMTDCPPVVDADGTTLALDTLRRRYLDAAEASDCASWRLYRALNRNDSVRDEQVRGEALAARGLTEAQYDALGLRFVGDEQAAAEKERRRLACAER